MNKKLLLAALPVLMAMSSCTYMQSATVQKNGEFFAESTEANEEIFGAARELKRNEPLRLDPFSADFIKIGYQIKFDDKNNADASDDVISIRFVAALKNAGVKAYWHRGLAQPNAYEGAAPDGVNWKFKFNDGITNESKLIYETLTDGTNTITAKTGDYAAYEGFAIYTLTNIPYEDYKDSYLAAYVEVIDEENEDTNKINSKVLAVKIERNGTASKNRFFFDANTKGHFLQGTINDVIRDGSDEVNHQDVLRATEHNSGFFYASYDDVDFEASDSFGSFYYEPGLNPHFQFFGNSVFFDGSREYFEADASLGEYVSPKAELASYNFNLKVYSGSTPTENHVFATSTTTGANQNFVLKNMPNWLSNANAVLIANIHKGDDTWMYAEVPFVRGSENDDEYNGSASFVAPNNIIEFELIRCVSGTTTSSVVWDNAHIWNITTGKINVSTNKVYGLNASEWKGY